MPLPPLWPTGPLDVTVTFDGTWSKRGYTGLYGVFVVISWDTGRVLDTIILSKHCGKCARRRVSMTENSQEYQDWYELHESKCTINHSGSSVAMEVEGALKLWQRSVERLNLRYVNVISDGDSKSIKALQEAQPYGEDVHIVKYECVGHFIHHFIAFFSLLFVVFSHIHTHTTFRMISSCTRDM